jgi:hypothetical protein
MPKHWVDAIVKIVGEDDTGCKDYLGMHGYVLETNGDKANVVIRKFRKHDTWFWMDSLEIVK